MGPGCRVRLSWVEVEAPEVGREQNKVASPLSKLCVKAFARTADGRVIGREGRYSTAAREQHGELRGRIAIEPSRSLNHDAERVRQVMENSGQDGDAKSNVAHCVRNGTPIRRCSLATAGGAAHGGRVAWPWIDRQATFFSMNAPLKRITVDPRVCGGQPCVRGLRIPVSLVLRHLAAGRTSAQIIDEFPELEATDIAECLRYTAWLASGRTIEIPPAA